MEGTETAFKNKKRTKQISAVPDYSLIYEYIIAVYLFCQCIEDDTLEGVRGENSINWPQLCCEF